MSDVEKAFKAAFSKYTEPGIGRIVVYNAMRDFFVAGAAWQREQDARIARECGAVGTEGAILSQSDDVSRIVERAPGHAEAMDALKQAKEILSQDVCKHCQKGLVYDDQGYFRGNCYMCGGPATYAQQEVTGGKKS